MRGRLGIVAGLLFLVSGCGEPMGKVTGRVEWNEEPVAVGEIQFEPLEDKTLPISSGLIQNGKFEVALPPGEKRVRIFVYEKRGTDRSNPAAPIDIITNTMPEKYNTKSELICTVKKGWQEYHFPGK
ncbi:MAG: hypothetical protein Q4D62_05525 [Planctomycetia bacterium]|nr:hypothetical protein [Planctomycetia bacterium]